MRIQTEVIQVANKPQIIHEVNAEAAIWGWSVLNIQITEQKIVKEGDSHGRESVFGDKYIITTEVITEHINYATITYQRDLDDPKIKKLADLESDYIHRKNANNEWFLSDDEARVYKESLAVEDKKDRDKLFGKILLGASVVCLFLSSNPLFNALTFVCFGVSVFFFGKAFCSSEYRNAKENIDRLSMQAYKARKAAQEDILEEAKRMQRS